jgi:hypothetical protein
LAEADSHVVQKESSLKREAKRLRQRLEDIFDNTDPNEFLGTLLVADQNAHKPKVESHDLDHPKFYWVFRNMDYNRWFAQDSGVLLLSGPTSCVLDQISFHVLGLMEKGCFENDRIVLNFSSPDGATRGNGPIRRSETKETVTIFAHTLLHQLISSTTKEGKTRIPAAYDFLCHLLDSIDDLRLLARFRNIGQGDPLAVIREVLDAPDTTLCDALGKVLEGEKDLRIVVNVSDNMRGREGNYIAAVSTFIGRLSEKNPGLKALLTGVPADDSRMTLGGAPCIRIQYDKERKGLIALYFPTLR